MSGSREQVLARIGRALKREAQAEGSSPDGQTVTLADQPAEVRRRLENPKSHTLPALKLEPGKDLADTLIERMESVQMSVVRLQSSADIVEAVRWYFESENISGAVTVSPELGELDWPDDYQTGAASGVERSSVTPCFAAVAETGSVALLSGAGTPATLNFLPDNHIVVVKESQIVSHLDDVFPKLRAHSESSRELPRALNFVTGPSRTADIEQTIEIGAHGPRRMHVLLLASDL